MQNFSELGRARLLAEPPVQGFSFIEEVPHDNTRFSAGPYPAHKLSLRGGGKNGQGEIARNGNKACTVFNYPIFQMVS